ncbi:hypothetical protein M8818_005065 [Zalaria obscura]|uniref:Uncharacterized protein n=1 Tax=Zalaria obscura TaxID=2024903 RepID=A0ACC3SAW3_9PEZI
MSRNAWYERVHTVRVTVHNEGKFENALGSDNHTTQYLLLPNSGSVQINMSTEKGFIDGNYAMAPKEYQVSRSEILHFDYPAVNPFTPYDVDALLKRDTFHEFVHEQNIVNQLQWLQDHLSANPQRAAQTLHNLAQFAIQPTTAQALITAVTQRTAIVNDLAAQIQANDVTAQQGARLAQ